MSKRLTTKQAPPNKDEPKVTKRLRGKQAASEAAADPPEAAGEEAAIAPSKYDAMLRKIYYDVEEGFGSLDDVYKAARKKNQKSQRKL